MKTRLPPWMLSVDSPHFHAGRQGKICLERGTALVCRVIIALANYLSCRLGSFHQCVCSLATSSMKSP